MNTTSKLAVFTRLRSPAVIGYTAFVWAFIFAVAHIYWAAGGTVGLQGNSMTGLLFWINLIAIPLCLLAAVTAFALTVSWNQIIPHWLWLTAAWGASILLGLRGTLGLSQSILLSNHVPLLLMAYDTWFLLGGALFCMLALAERSR